VKKQFSIAVLPGDGIGREVMQACLEVLAAIQKISSGPELLFNSHPAGAQLYMETGESLPPSTLEACVRADAILFGAMGWPGVYYKDGTEISPQLDLRMALDLYAGVRPIRWFPGLPSVLSDDRAKKIDFVLIREQTEGLFYARGRGNVIADQESFDTMKITRHGTARVTNFAFRLAEQRRASRGTSRVTCVDKANVFTSMAFFRKIFYECSQNFPSIEKEHAYVDAMALNMVKKPWTLDVLVTENMFGDILSDLGAGLIGGMGMAPSGDIGDNHALFQPSHGTAPDIAGRGIANPCAMILSAAMMLDWLAVRHEDPQLALKARLIESAIADSLIKGTIPMELGGKANCEEMTLEIIKSLSK
jgi:3-isopropylmalate dehydrogenase